MLVLCRCRAHVALARGRDHSADLHDVRNVLTELLGIPRTTHEDRLVVKRVCELVGLRAARLAAVGIAAVVRWHAQSGCSFMPAPFPQRWWAVQVTKINRTSGCTVAVDGSVFLHYPHFASRMRDGTSAHT
jgi:hexokinase